MLADHQTPLTIAILGTWGKFTVQLLLQRIFNEFGGSQPVIYCIPTHLKTPPASYIAKLQPDVLIVTNSGAFPFQKPATISPFAREQAAKIAECFAYLPGQTLVVLNLDDPQADSWVRYTSHLRQITYTIYNVVQADYVLFQAIYRPPSRSVLLVRTRMQDYTVKTCLPGECQWPLLLAALATAVELNVTDLSIIPAIATVSAVPRRLQRLNTSWKHIMLFDDTHAPTPFSVATAIDLIKCFGIKTLLVLGDLLTLGENAHAEHEALGELARLREIDEVLPLGLYGIGDLA